MGVRRLDIPEVVCLVEDSHKAGGTGAEITGRARDDTEESSAE